MEMLASKIWTSLVGDMMLSVVVLKGAILAAVVVVLGLALRRVSAASRSVLWTAGFTALLVLPLLVPRLPVWEVGVAEFPQRLFEAGAASSTAAAAPPIIAWLALAWALGAFLLLCRFGLHAARIAAVTRRARPVHEGSLATIADEVASDLGIRRVKVALSDSPGVPLTWGLWRPVVLLPRDARAWPIDRQRAVLHHEMAHVARHDYVSLVIMEICRAIHWPNALVWWLARQARLDQERACDDAAIRAGIDASDYARHLVAVARSFAFGTPHPAAALPIIRTSSLRQRVEAVMERGADHGPATLRTVAMALALVAVTAVPLAAANLWTCPDRSANGNPTAASPVAQTTTFAASEELSLPDARPAGSRTLEGPSWTVAAPAGEDCSET